MHRFGKGIPSIVIFVYLKERKVNFIFLLERTTKLLHRLDIVIDWLYNENCLSANL